MARDTTRTRRVPVDGFRQFNVLVPNATVETLDRLKAVCNVPLVDLVKMSVELFRLAHDTEARGGRLIFVQADGSKQQVVLPSLEIRLQPEASETPEAPV